MSLITLPISLAAISSLDASSITANSGTVVGSGSWGTVLNDSSPGSQRTLISGGGTGLGGNVGIRSTIGNILFSHPARYYLFYLEAKLINSGGSFPFPSNAAWGLADATADVSGFNEGENNDSAGLLSYQMNGDIFLAGTQVATAGDWSTGETTEALIDIAGGTAQFRVKGDNWTAAIDFTSALSGRIYIFGGMQLRANFNANKMYFDFGQTTFDDQVPAGYQKGWGTPFVEVAVLTWDGKRIAP